MHRILGSRSAMRKYLEQEMLAESLQGRIRYGCTSYVGMDGCRIFELCIDGKQVKRFSLETVNSYFIDMGYKKEDPREGIRGYWAEFWILMDQYPIDQRTEYTDVELCDALTQYRSRQIGESLASDNPLVRMFAVLDRRVGRRTLVKLADTLPQQPQWLREIYRLRLDAESV